MSKAYTHCLWTALNGLHNKQLPNMAWVNKDIETKYIAQGNKNIGDRSRGARTHGPTMRRPPLFHWTTRMLYRYDNILYYIPHT